MDIYSARNAVDKLHGFVKDLKGRNPKLYQKSKDRLLYLSETCLEVVDLISELLHEESLNYDSGEFENSADYSIQEALESASSTLRNSISDISNSSQQKLSSASKKIIVKTYGEVLKSGSNFDYIETHYAEEVSKLLWDWYESRIFTHSGFYYSLSNFPKWIASIVATYGNSIQDGKTSEYVYMFRDWCKHAYEHTYPLPKEVQYFLDDTTQAVSLSSVVMWDILYKNNFYRLGNLELDAVSLSDSYMFNLCEIRSPDILDKYGRYEDNNNILVRAGLVN